MEGAQSDPLAEHREFLNRYYGVSRWFYDLTRKYYLFGRDRLLTQLESEPWETLLEIGPGTGRNLRKLQHLRPEARFGGLEACDEMLAHARRACPWAVFSQGFAERADLRQVLGRAPDRILFSYCLSMVQEPEQALAQALRALEPGGELAIVDFSGFSGVPRQMGGALEAWLRTFHVEPLKQEMLLDFGARVERGPLDYFIIARIRARSPTSH